MQQHQIYKKVPLI